MLAVGDSHLEWFEGNFADYEEDKLEPHARHREERSDAAIQESRAAAGVNLLRDRFELCVTRSRSRRDHTSCGATALDRRVASFLAMTSFCPQPFHCS
jgi:hypothetical protein